MPQDPVRIAKLSFAHVHAEGYAKAIQDNPQAELVAAWDEDPDRGQAMADKYGVPFEPDLGALLARDDIQAVANDCTTKLHREVLLKCCAAGKHIFTEKALTIATREADEVVAAVEQSGIKFMISLPSRTRPEVLWLKQVVDQGLIGDLTYIRTRIAHSAALDKWFGGDKAWFADADAAGGGGLFDLGCHTVDITRWLGGPPKQVVALMNSFAGTYPDVDDNATAVVEFESKALACMECAWVQRQGPNPMEVYGTEGYASIGTTAGRPVIQSTKVPPDDLADGKHPKTLPPARPAPMQQWLNAIQTGSEMTITVRDGRNLTELLEGCYRSWQEGKAIPFPL